MRAPESVRPAETIDACAFDAQRIARLLADAGARTRLEILDRCGSTNDVVAERMCGCPEGDFLAAATDEQTAGRGRRGTTWTGVRGASLAVSVGTRVARPPQWLAALPLAIGVGCVDALAEAGAGGVRLKWPNDLLVGREKLGGILVESRPEAQATRVIVGVGVNLRPAAAAAVRHLREATCVADLVGDRFDATALLAALVVRIESTVRAFAAGGFAGFQSRWSALHAWAGQPVVATCADGRRIEGRAAGIDANGALLIEGADGVRAVLAADVSLRAP